MGTRDEDGYQRHLETPERTAERRSEDVSRRSRSRRRSDLNVDNHTGRCSHHRSRSPVRHRGRSHSLREKERELEREREKLRHLEDEVFRERSRLRSISRHQESSRFMGSADRCATPRQTGQRPGRSDEHEGQRNEPDIEELRKQNSKRSASPSFSSKDVINLLKTLKSTSHPSAGSSNNLNHKNILPDFDPSSKNQRTDIWLRKVNECATVYGWDDKTIVHFAMQKLQGLAKVWYEGLNSILYSWSEWQEKLLTAFPCEENYGQSLEEMLKRKSRPNEPIEVYYYEKVALLTRCGIDGKRAVDCIIHGLTDKTMKSSALTLRCSNPEALLQFLMSNKEAAQSGQYPDRFRGRFVTDAKPNQSNLDYRNRSNTGNSNRSVFCFNCKERGHPFMKCPKPLLKCYTCNKFGHKSEACRFKSEIGENKNDIVHKAMCITASKNNSKYNKEVTINGSNVNAFVDFGSEVSLMKKSVVPTLGLICDNVSVPLKGFGNEVVNSFGSVSAVLEIDGVKANVEFHTVDDKFLDVPILVGQSFTELPHVIVYKNSENLNFYNLDNEMPFTGLNIDNNQTVKLTTVASVDLDGPATIKAVADPPIDGNIIVSSKVVGKPTEQFTIYGGVYRVINGFVNVTVAPVASRLQLIMGTTFCRATRILVVHRIVSSESNVSEPNKLEHSKIDESMISIGKSADEHDKQKLFKILRKYNDCFASTLKELGCTDVAEMSIEINSKQPIVYRPYRLSHKERDEVRHMVNEMLEAGIIRESVSEYASPIILVRKKTGKLRMCIDYRLLNSVTVKERYPMPIIEDEIARLSGQAYFVTLDLASGYYQVPLTEQSKPLTSFVTPDGQYEFNRMPFGLANAPAVFQRMMNKVLGSSRYTDATAYLDDVLIYGRDKDECLVRLEKVLNLLAQANLTLNLSKCDFLSDKIDYLGYEISAVGIRPGDKKVRCVLDFPKPTNLHTVRQFLGLVGYFRKFIRNFAQIAHPISKLLRKDVVWCWADEQDNAFETLKGVLTERPVLAIYDPAAETELHTDASKVGVGGILLQRSLGGDAFRPVAFYSRQTTPEEKHFHAYELETLAVVCSLRKFRVYLLGQDFKIVSDCSALRSTFTKRDIIPRVARWWLLLQEFQCTIEYRPGTRMSHVDALSRNPVQDDDTVDALSQYPTVMSISSDDWLHTLQLGDTELCRIRDILTSDIDVDGLKYIRDNYLIKDNKLYKTVDGDNTNIRWVVPKGARWQLCRMNHDDIGHFGVEKTLERIKKSYWFPKMSRFIKKYVQACVHCAYAKKNAHAKEGHLHVIEKVEVPFHTVHIDHLGPFVRSKRGNTHLLVIVEAFTKFVFVKPVRNTKTTNAIRALEDVFYIFRFPDRIISDRGSCFTSHAFKRFCLEKGVRHVLNAVSSPRSNGQVERYNRSILDSLRATNLNNHEKEWDESIGVVQWGLNNTIQKTTGRSPAEVMFGTSMNAELNPTLNEIRQGTYENNDLATIRKEVKDRIEEKQTKQKDNYDRGRKPARKYNHGDLVKITRVAFNNDGKSTKLMPSYIGPYRVIRVLGNDRYKLASIPGLTGTKNKRKTTVAADRMRPWVHVTALEIGNDSNDEDVN